jgi:hypothetical protein
LERLPAEATSPDGTKVVLTLDDWLHVRFRHPEVGTDPAVLLGAVSDPDEVHSDERGGIHALKRLDQDHFLVVIYESTDEASGGLIRTAFMINEGRKNRRYSKTWRARQS